MFARIGAPNTIIVETQRLIKMEEPTAKDAWVFMILDFGTIVFQLRERGLTPI